MIKNNVNFGKMAYDQVINLEKEKLISKSNNDFLLKSQTLFFNNKNIKSIHFKSLKYSLMTICIDIMTKNTNYNVCVIFNNTNVLNIKNINSDKKTTINVVAEKDNNLQIITNSESGELISFKIKIIGEFKEINDKQYMYMIPSINESYGLLYNGGDVLFSKGNIDDVINFKDSINLNSIEVLDFKSSLKNDDFLTRFENFILLTYDDGVVLKEYNTSGFQTEHRLNISSMQNIKYLPINNEKFKHQLIGLKDGNVVTYFLDNDFNIVKSMILKLIKKNQIKEIYTINYFENVKYENMFIVKDILDNLYLYINNDNTFSTEGSYSEPIFIGKGGVKSILYLKDNKLILINTHSNKVDVIEFDFNTMSKVKKISRVKEKEYLNITELLFGTNDKVLLWSLNNIMVQDYE